MSRIASIFRSEPGWRVLSAVTDEENKTTIQFSFIHAWGLMVPDPRAGSELKVPLGVPGVMGYFAPLSMSNHILTEKEGYIGIVNPEETDDQAVERFGTNPRLRIPPSE